MHFRSNFYLCRCYWAVVARTIPGIRNRCTIYSAHLDDVQEQLYFSSLDFGLVLDARFFTWQVEGISSTQQTPLSGFNYCRIVKSGGYQQSPKEQDEPLSILWLPANLCPDFKLWSLRKLKVSRMFEINDGRIRGNAQHLSYEWSEITNYSPNSKLDGGSLFLVVAPGAMKFPKLFSARAFTFRYFLFLRP